ncbi:MAG: hypothetical protein ACI4V2_04410 [Alloprevotella sp.]
MQLFIGKQSTGKSTLLKVLCFCQWVEKRALLDGKDFVYNYTHYYRFRKDLCRFFRLPDDFFKISSLIDYEGEAYRITLSGRGNARVLRQASQSEQAGNSKLCFVPAERNLLFAFNKNVDNVFRSGTIDALFNFVLEWGDAHQRFSDGNVGLDMPFDPNIRFFYDKGRDADMFKLKDEAHDYPMYYGSSGLQSAAPILVMVQDAFSQVGTTAKSTPADLLSMVKRYIDDKGVVKKPISEVAEDLRPLLTYNKAHLFIEEPEQNLFPESQHELVLALVRALVRTNQANQTSSTITLTSHSPYILTAINMLLYLAQAGQKSPESLTDAERELLLPVEAFTAYRVGKDGNISSIIDPESRLISGDYLDAVSETYEERVNRYVDIIYG